MELAHSYAEATLKHQSQNFEIVLLDIQLPDGSGLALIDKLLECCPNRKIIIVTALDSASNGIEAMRLGVFEFLVKPFDAARLYTVIEKALKTSFPISSDRRRSKFIGSSNTMQAVYQMIDSAAESDVSVFITGESGTGKEIAALSIHEQSKRAKEEFHAINCAAIPSELMESEIFGHRKGAFSGALENREGAAEVANNGTLFLDEICEMSLEVQKKMLRFIQTGQYQKVGSDKINKSNARIICATNRDPLKEVQSGRFRLDLYYRLHVIPIHLPPLRDRSHDILLLADYFLFKFSKLEGQDFKSFSDETMQILSAYYWPGNVRELQNVIQNVVVLNKGLRVEKHMLPNSVTDGGRNKISAQSQEKKKSQLIEFESNSNPLLFNRVIPLKESADLIIKRAIEICDGNIQLAAAKLEIAPSTIYRKLKSDYKK